MAFRTFGTNGFHRVPRHVERPPSLDCDWNLIHGEPVTFTDPKRDPPPIDRLEGFRPGERSIYRRVTVAALKGSTACAVWTYIMNEPQDGVRITSVNQAVFWKNRH